MDVPGLSGSWRDRLKQYYKALTGKNYRGTLEEGLYMLDQIKKRNFPQVQPAPAPKPKPAAQPQQTIAEQYTSDIAKQAEQVANTPSFQEALPFYEAWGRFLPQASETAASQINPEVMRDYRANLYDVQSNLADTGGQRFGRGLGQIGDLKAQTERNRQAQMQDWLSQYQQGYKTLFYEPSETAWNQAVTLGKAPDQQLKQVPTWDEVYSKYNDAYTPGETSSPLYG